MELNSSVFNVFRNCVHAIGDGKFIHRESRRDKEFHFQTLILPDGFEVIDGFKQVGRLVRKEADKLIVGYTFDLKHNTLTPEVIPNPSAGLEHHFLAWRLEDGPNKIVTMREIVSATIKDKRDNAE